ncbi:MAG: hypothetical protein GY760_22155 [Deltaproteobacteria bacterium]|nr:hypothetical protein [Deltaproteobacteria bacterium]
MRLKKGLLTIISICILYGCGPSVLPEKEYTQIYENIKNSEMGYDSLNELISEYENRYIIDYSKLNANILMAFSSLYEKYLTGPFSSPHKLTELYRGYDKYFVETKGSFLNEEDVGKVFNEYYLNGSFSSSSYSSIITEEQFEKAFKFLNLYQIYNLDSFLDYETSDYFNSFYYRFFKKNPKERYLNYLSDDVRRLAFYFYNFRSDEREIYSFLLRHYSDVYLVNDIHPTIRDFYSLSDESIESGKISEYDFSKIFHNLDSIPVDESVPFYYFLKQDIQKYIDPQNEFIGDSAFLHFFKLFKYSGDERGFSILDSDFLQWCINYLIPDRYFKVQDKEYWKIYKNFRDEVRLYFLVYSFLESTGQIDDMFLEFKQKVADGNESVDAFLSFYYPDLSTELSSKFELGYKLNTFRVYDVAGFWLRRIGDESAPFVYSLLEEILDDYDADWLSYNQYLISVIKDFK